MRFSHYRDALRQAITQAIAVQGSGAQAFSIQLSGQALPPNQQALAAAFANINPSEAATLSMAANATTAHVGSPSHPGLSCQQAAQQILVRAAHGPFYIAQLAADASSQLLGMGINPGGFGQDVLWTDPRKKNGSWHDLYVWGQPGSIPQPKSIAQLTQQHRDHLRRIQDQSLIETMDVVFASGRRSLEALRIAYATTDTINAPAPNALILEAADGAIRLLGARRRLSTHGAAGQPNAPGYVTQYLAAIAQRHGLTPATFVSDVLNYLNTAGLITQYVLTVPNLCLMRAGQSYFECPQCRRIHLHPSGTICTDCQSTLGPPQPIAGANIQPDYYSYLATQAGPLFRLNCEELTGQTSKNDARKRQRLFQDIAFRRPMRFVRLTRSIC